ncbi:MAG: endonuclease/exonuclease/phosphatase family protein [Bacteroidota bacterium]|nr:endonuclease/exonuclease/phosphatase family protein [Bacteroidota bacterium]
MKLSTKILHLSLMVLWVLISFCLLVAIVSPYINPQWFWPPALFGLLFKVWVILEIFVFTLALLINYRSLYILSFIIICCSLPGLSKSFGIWPRTSNKDPKKNIRVMTYNVANFNWFTDSANLQNLYSNFSDIQPDVLCMQEYSEMPGKVEKVEEFLARQGLIYNYKHITRDVKGPNKVGLAIFSKYPFRNVVPIPFFATANGAFCVDVSIRGDTLRMINVHFQSIGMRKREVEIPVTDEEKEIRTAVFRSSLKKLREGFRKRSVQGLEVCRAIDSSRYPVIVCGDFNDSPVSYVYKQLTQRLTDAWLHTNFGLGSTYAGFVPFQRIDYIMTGPNIKIAKAKILRHQGSDHLPLFCDFSILTQ